MTCCRCNRRMELEPEFDHHDRICHHCGVTCVFLRWDKWTQVVAADAPHHAKAFIAWSQRNLGEVEFVELMGFLEDVLAHPPATPTSSQSDPHPPASEPGRSGFSSP